MEPSNACATDDITRSPPLRRNQGKNADNLSEKKRVDPAPHPANGLQNLQDLADWKYDAALCRKYVDEAHVLSRSHKNKEELFFQEQRGSLYIGWKLRRGGLVLMLSLPVPPWMH